MGAPLLIGIAGGQRDREVTSSLLRTVLDGGQPYRRVGVVGSRELYDGVEWRRRPNPTRELGRLDEHLAHARESGLSYRRAELDEAAERGTMRLDLLCSVGAGGTGTARTASRSLSFSARSPLADVGASQPEVHYGYVHFLAHTPDWSARLAVPVTGLFDLGPSLGAVASAVLLGVDVDRLSMGLLTSKVPGHGELLVSPDHRVLALIEESRARRDTERLVSAARETYDPPHFEVVRGAAAVGDAVARAYASDTDGRTLLVLLGHPSERLEDAFQDAVREHARPLGS